MTTVETFFLRALILTLLTFNATSTALAQGSILTWGELDDQYLVSSRISGSDFIAVSGTLDHSFALRSDGSIVVSAGEGGLLLFQTPIEPGFLSVDGGFEHGVALKADGSIVSWGDDSYGQISNTPLGNDFIHVTAGEYHSAALKQDGSIVSWGFDEFGQVTNQPSGTNFVSVEAGINYSLALSQDGSVVGWGDNEYNQVSAIPTGNDIVSISAGGWHGVALKQDGTIVSWGADYTGQVSQTPLGSDFIAIAGAASGLYSLGLKTDGSIVHWGEETSGIPTDTNYTAISEGIALKADGSVHSWNGSEFVSSVTLAPAGNDYVDISAGSTHALALRQNGSLLSWGDFSGIAIAETPEGTDFIAISTGDEYSIALKQDGSIVSWGDPSEPAPTGNDFVSISSGFYHNMALRASGSIVSWGEDFNGQVSSMPTENNFVAISAGESHSIALRIDGSLASWGDNFSGAVTDTPTDSGYSAISAGAGYSVALRTDGTVVSWGMDDEAQVTDAPNDTDIVAISAGSCHAVAQHSDGSLTSWGCDENNQVTETPSGTNFIALAAGISSSHAITGDIITPPTITTPIAGSSLASADDLVVEWLPGNQAISDWWLFVGSSVGSKNYHDSGSLDAAQLQTTASNIPADGSVIYLRLWYRTTDTDWEFVQHSAIASGMPPAITFPTAGGELYGAVQTFEWLDNGANVVDHQLYVGSAIGLNDYYNSGLLGTDLSVTAVGLPADGGSTVYVRLWYKKSSGTWAFTDATYQAGINPPTSPVIINREAGSVLAGMVDTFEWDANGSGATQYWLQIGSAIGTQQHFSSSTEGATSAVVSSLPTNGNPVWVRLWYRAGAGTTWAYTDNEYTASGTGPTLSISSGTDTLISSDDTFSWNDTTGTITSWWLYVGSSIGGREYEHSGPLTGVTDYTTTESNLPSGSVIVHARLWYQQGDNTVWQWIDRQFVSAQ